MILSCDNLDVITFLCCIQSLTGTIFHLICHKFCLSGALRETRNREKYLFDVDNDFHQYVTLTFDYTGYKEYLDNLASIKVRDKTSVVRQKDESQNGSNKKAKHAKFFEKRTFLTPLIRTRTFFWKNLTGKFEETLLRLCQVKVVPCRNRFYLFIKITQNQYCM